MLVRNSFETDLTLKKNFMCNNKILLNEMFNSSLEKRNSYWLQMLYYSHFFLNNA